MRPAVLLVELPYSIEYLRPEVEGLVQALPPGSKPVMYTDRMIAIGLLDVAVPEEALARAHKALRNFSRHWFLGATGVAISSDGAIDPLESWMRENFGTSPIRKRRQAQNVADPQRRLIRLKGAD